MPEAGRFKARIAQDALLGLAGRPVEVGLLVGAARDAHAPGTATLLAHQHHAILTALVDRALRASRNAARIEAVVADTRQVEEDRAVDLVDLAHFLVGGAIEVRIVVCINLRAAKSSSQFGPASMVSMYLPVPIEIGTPDG